LDLSKFIENCFAKVFIVLFCGFFMRESNALESFGERKGNFMYTLDIWMDVRSPPGSPSSPSSEHRNYIWEDLRFPTPLRFGEEIFIRDKRGDRLSLGKVTEKMVHGVGEGTQVSVSGGTIIKGEIGAFEEVLRQYALRGHGRPYSNDEGSRDLFRKRKPFKTLH